MVLDTTRVVPKSVPKNCGFPQAHFNLWKVTLSGLSTRRRNASNHAFYGMQTWKYNLERKHGCVRGQEEQKDDIHPGLDEPNSLTSAQLETRQTIKLSGFAWTTGAI